MTDAPAPPIVPPLPYWHTIAPMKPKRELDEQDKGLQQAIKTLQRQRR